MVCLLRFVFIAASFALGGRAGRDDADAYAGRSSGLVGVNDGEELACRVEPKREPAIFVPAVGDIVDGKRQRIQEHGGSLVECDAVLTNVCERLGGIPFEVVGGLVAHVSGAVMA